MSKYVFDIESNGLLDTISTIWCLVMQDVETKEIFSYSDYDDDLPSLAKGMEHLMSAKLLIGHNIINYDAPAIKLVLGIDILHKDMHDTLIFSRVNRYKRPFIGHSLKAWGQHLGDNKLQYDDWTQYTKQMLTYCKQDVELNTNVYEVLMKEYQALKQNNPLIAEGMRVEHEIAKIQARITEDGWNFDVKKAKETHKLMRNRMDVIEAELEPQIGSHKVFQDKEPKTAKYKKDGNYTTVTARILSEYLGKEVSIEDTHVMAPGVKFQRSKLVKIKLGQTELVKTWLLNKGWKPDAYNRKLINGSWQNTGPKLTETSLKKLGSLGEMLGEYTTLTNRYAILTGWLEKVKKGRLHGEMQTIGTPSFRARHSIIVNIPSLGAAWGKEMRELFRAEDGELLVGADSSGNQLRGLVHYVNNPEYTDIVVNGDQHQRNADFLGCTRPEAKTYLYAYLFGAGDGTLGEVLTGKASVKIGKESRAKFAAGIKGLKELDECVKKAWTRRSITQNQGWIFGLDGRPLFVPTDRQCLNYLLQCAEGITCKAAVVWADMMIKKEGLRAKMRIMYHDEMQISSHPDDAERVKEIAALSFKEAPKAFKVMVMDGEGVIGKNYAETH